MQLLPHYDIGLHNFVCHIICQRQRPEFTSHAFAQFTKSNCIKHISTKSCHASSNGGAECFVQTTKKGLLVVRIDKGDAEIKLRNFLLSYRTTPTTTTGQKQSELFLDIDLVHGLTL